MSPTVQRQQAAPWPLARRAVAGLAQPGGSQMAHRALEGIGLESADRVVELAPGLGLTSKLALAATPRTWTAVEPDPLAAEHLERTLGGPGREVVGAPVGVTGLEEASSSAVLTDALLSTLDEQEAAEVLAEAARLLRAGGRLALHELAPAPGAEDAETRSDLEGIGLRPRSVDAWRALAEGAGLVVIGSLAGRLALPAPRDLMREAGPRTALRITRELARDGALRTAATSSREAIERRSLALRSALVVAEKPLILGMRRPRR